MPRARVTKRRVGSDEEMEHDQKENQPAQRGGEPNAQADRGRNNGDQEEYPAFDPRTFEHAPIPAANHPKLKAVTDSWDGISAPLNMLEQLIRDCGPMLAEIDGVDSNELQKLDQLMRAVIDEKEALAARRNASQEIREELTQGKRIIDPATLWQQKSDAALAEYEKKTARQKYGKNRTYEDYRADIWACDPDHEGEGMPPLQSLIPREEGDDESDDDVEVGGVVQDYLDPLTRQMLENPMTSKVCGHSYSRASIYEFLGNQTKACPTSGCNRRINKNDLVPDENIERRVRARKRQLEQAKGGRRKRDKAIVLDSDEDEMIKDEK